MKIIAFAGSNSSKSINKQLVTYVCSFFKENNVELLDLNDYEMPIYSMDREEKNGIPELARQFAEKIDTCDLVIISFAEHNGAYSTAFKNIFDWISRIPDREAFGYKPMFLMAASDGPRGGRSVLKIATDRMPWSGGKVLDTFSLPEFSKNFPQGIGITNKILNDELIDKINFVKLKVKN